MIAKMVDYLWQFDRTNNFWNIKKDKTKKIKPIEFLAELIIYFSTFITVASLVVITVFILIKGIPGIFKIGLFNFLFGMKWIPSEEVFGIFPMIVSTLLGTFIATIIGSAIGILTAVYMLELAPDNIVGRVRSAIQLLAAIPSVVYGFFGLIVIVPAIDKLFGGGGNSLLAVIIILSIMILPIIISISEVAIKSVPKEYKEGSLALGASKMQTVFRVMIPAAKSGIMAAVVLGIGRAVGETMAVILVAGNSPIMPESINGRVRTMTANIALEMGYAFGIHQEALFATGVVLFAFIMIINVILNKIINKGGSKA